MTTTGTTFEVWVPFAITYQTNGTEALLHSIDGPQEGDPFTAPNGDIWCIGSGADSGSWGTDETLSIDALTEASRAAQALT